MIRVYFDENIPIHACRAIRELEKSRGDFEIFHTTEVLELGKGATDDQIVQHINDSGGGVLITKDRDFKSRSKTVFALAKKSDTGIIITTEINGTFFSQFEKLFHNWHTEMRGLILKHGNKCSFKFKSKGAYETF